MGLAVAVASDPEDEVEALSDVHHAVWGPGVTQMVVDRLAHVQVMGITEEE